VPFSSVTIAVVSSRDVLPLKQTSIVMSVARETKVSQFFNLTSDTKEKAERAKMPSTHVQNPERAWRKNRKTDILQIKHPKSLVS
jgi:hypothetical protein